LLAHGRWFSPCTLASSTTKTGRHDIAEILLKVALNTKDQIKSIIHVLCIINNYLFIYLSFSFTYKITHTKRSSKMTWTFNNIIYTFWTHVRIRIRIIFINQLKGPYRANTRNVRERRHQCLSITWYGWKLSVYDGSQLVSHLNGTNMFSQWITQR